jgi:hypothetical protein
VPVRRSIASICVLGLFLFGCGSTESAGPPPDDDTGTSDATLDAEDTDDTFVYDGDSDGPCTTRVFSALTTLTALNANNTSASATFKGTTNGNAGAGNVSQLPLRTLFYSGAKTRLYGHVVGWFGSSGHLDVGYKSDDASQVKRQIDDMLARGLDGAIVDWLGPAGTTVDAATKLLLAEAEKRSGKFEVAVMEDGASLKGCTTDCTTKLVADLAYAYDNFEKSTAYMKIAGRPVIFFAGVDSLSIDWAMVRSKVSGDPVFVPRNDTAFGNPSYQGAHCWASPVKDAANWGKGYLDAFYTAALKNPTSHAFGCAYKGYDDAIATPSEGKKTDQRCGRTFLDSLAAVSSHYSTSTPLEAFQLVTWNDYENGTALEVGIDNCGVTTSLDGNKLSWTMSTPESVDHFELYVSMDGENLMPLRIDLPPTTTAIDLPSQGLSAGTYKFHLRAMGIPFFRNQVSAPVAWTTAGDCVGRE